MTTLLMAKSMCFSGRGMCGQPPYVRVSHSPSLNALYTRSGSEGKPHEPPNIAMCSWCLVDARGTHQLPSVCGSNMEATYLLI